MSSVELTPGYVTFGQQPVKAWVRGVPFEASAQEQVFNLAGMPWIYKHVAVMPDVHAGRGSTVGTVFATKDVVVPAAVGVDIGCGMLAERIQLVGTHGKPLFGNGVLGQLRGEIERLVPVGGPGLDVGSWPAARLPKAVDKRWEQKFAKGYDQVVRTMQDFAANRDEAKKMRHPAPERQLGTLGGGNHFIEICLDEHSELWIMLHSGSRGAGNKIGDFYTRIAQRKRKGQAMPDKDLAWLDRGEAEFAAYVEAMTWAQQYAWESRLLMLDAVREAFWQLDWEPQAEWVVHCHHNYLASEQHFGESVLVVRKGATSAQAGQYGIIPGSMGARSFIVKGLGNPESFMSCSHGAGRTMSRGAAKRQITLEEHVAAMAGIEGRTDRGVIDESPAAYKDVEAVMAAQVDLVTPVHVLKQILVVKG